MLNRLVACYILLLTTTNGISLPDNLLVLYGNDHSQIIIKDVNTRETKKIFTIQIKEPTGGIAIYYENDLIFFVEGTTIYRIHLVDEDGKRKLSGRGELFANKNADHFEMVFDMYSVRFNSLVFDDSTKMMYAMYYLGHSAYVMGFIKIDPETGYTLTTKMINAHVSSSFTLCHGMLYNLYRDTIYNITTRALDDVKAWQQLINLKSTSQFTVDNFTNMLFYTQQENLIRMLDGNLTSIPISSMKRPYVMADSEVTKKINAIAVYGNIVVWSSSAWNRLYIGELNKMLNFMPRRSVHVLDGDGNFNNIIIFKDDYKR